MVIRPVLVVLFKKESPESISMKNIWEIKLNRKLRHRNLTIKTKLPNTTANIPEVNIKKRFPWLKIKG